MLGLEDGGIYGLEESIGGRCFVFCGSDEGDIHRLAEKRTCWY